VDDIGEMIRKRKGLADFSIMDGRKVLRAIVITSASGMLRRVISNLVSFSGIAQQDWAPWQLAGLGYHCLVYKSCCRLVLGRWEANSSQER
jgi:hypothetical protein